MDPANRVIVIVLVRVDLLFVISHFMPVKQGVRDLEIMSSLLFESSFNKRFGRHFIYGFEIVL